MTDFRMRWLHISDFHIKSAESYDRDRVLSALTKSLPALIARTGAIDFIVASGDIAHSGKAAEYVRATKFFDEIVSALSLSRSELFVIPGNHDVDRTFNSTFSRTLSSPTSADDYFTSGNDLTHLTVKMAAYVAWYNEYFDGIRLINTRSTVQGTHSVSIDSKDVIITLLNSALFSADDHDHGKLIIGRTCLEEAYGSEASKSFRVTVVHHPLSWLSTVEGANIRSLVNDNSDIILSGHLHETDVAQTMGVNGSALYLAAGASYQGSDWPNTATICSLNEGSVEVMPIQFVDRPRPTWTVDPSVFPEEQTFRKSFVVPGLSGKADQGAENSDSAAVPQIISQAVANAFDEWQSDLFLTADGEPIYVEPRIMDQPQNAVNDENQKPEPISIDSIVNADNSFLIESRGEYGGSNLAKRVFYELLKANKRAVLVEARNIPTYKAKIIQEFIGRSSESASSKTFVIDNFDLERDGRMLRELSQSGISSRVVLICTNRDLSGVTLLDLSDRPFKPSRIYLWPMPRSGVRTATSLVFATDDPVFVSATVDKVYHDLLALCIPLSPPSCIMYLRVLAKESDFTPLNRVHIQNRFISEALSRSSDIYRGNFNSKNKIDITAAFAFSLFIDRISIFDKQRWFSFAEKHKRDTLKEFDTSDLLDELQSAGIIGRHGSNLFFKLSFFYNFFLGRYLASNRHELANFLAAEKYLESPSVIDVVSGLEADNVLILEKLCEELEDKLQQFAVKYVKAEFDPLLKAIWPDNDKEEEQLWNPVHAALGEGPQSIEVIDTVKTSVLAEARTADQQVVFRKFTDLEHALFIISTSLADALRNSDEVPAALKLKALDLVLRAELVAFQVGTIFADKLATQKHVRWGAVSFTDFNSVEKDTGTTGLSLIVDVIVELSLSVVSKISSEIGTYKLANVFRATAAGQNQTDFLTIALFACILEAKGPEWAKTLDKMIVSTKRDAFYLTSMLHLLMHSISMGLEKGRDMEEAKRLVALIHSKRANNKAAPGEKLIAAHLRTLEKRGEFDFEKEEND